MMNITMCIVYSTLRDATTPYTKPCNTLFDLRQKQSELTRSISNLNIKLDKCTYFVRNISEYGVLGLWFKNKNYKN
jgi:hypothetical protein